MSRVNLESASVQNYLGILQGVIGRMATNSASCKTWCIALVSAIVVIIADKEKPEYVWISIVPIVLLFFLNSYYLGLERCFRNLYSDFVRKVHNDSADAKDIFIITPETGLGNILLTTIRASGSISIWPFYVLLAVMLVVVKIWIL